MLPNVHDVVCIVMQMLCLSGNSVYPRAHDVLGPIGQDRIPSVMYTQYLARLSPTKIPSLTEED